MFNFSSQFIHAITLIHSIKGIPGGSNRPFACICVVASQVSEGLPDLRSDTFLDTP